MWSTLILILIKELRKLTSVEKAKTFEFGISAKNYENVKEQLECGCEPYQDVFTLKRWNVQGYKVKKGSKSIRTTRVVKKDIEITENGQKKTIQKSYPKNSFLFCRCQVEHK